MNLEQISNKVKEYLLLHKEEFLKDLTSLISIPSVEADAEEGAPYGKECARVLDCMLKLCEKYGFETHNFENYAGTAVFKGENDLIGLDVLSHLDVVATGTGWNTDPYTMYSDGEFIYGRGVADDKGPSLASLYALRALKELSLVPKAGIRLIFGCAEETGSSDLKHYFKTQKSAPHTFTPDSSFPVYNGEKGRYAPSFAIKVDDDNAGKRVTSFICGNAPNIVPERAKCTITGCEMGEIISKAKELERELCVKYEISQEDRDIQILCLGKSAHAAIPSTGINALTALIKLLCNLELDDCDSTRAFSSLNKILPHNDTSGKSAGIYMKEEISGEITIAFSMLHFDGTQLLGVCDMRLPFCATEENSKDIFTERMLSLGFNVSGDMIKPHYVNKDGDFVKSLNRCYELVTGNKGGALVTGGGTYVHDIEGGVAFGAMFDNYESNMHGANERVKMDDLLTAAQIFAISYLETAK